MNFFENLSFDWLKRIATNTYAMLAGLFTSVVGYFIPVRDIVHFLLLCFFLDVLFGFWAARKIRNERFSAKIIWQHTVPRMMISLIIIMACFMWDTVFSQEYLATYKLTGWFFCGVLIWSIAVNGYKITGWNAFKQIGGMVERKVEEQSGVDLKEEVTR